jgi:hypothetical protein
VKTIPIKHRVVKTIPIKHRVVKTIPIKHGVVKTIPMNAAQHAARILTAWNGADPLGFERELDHAASVSAAPADLLKVDLLEYERREVLNSVVERLRGREKSRACQSLNAGFVLLEHLSERAATA